MLHRFSRAWGRTIKASPLGRERGLFAFGPPAAGSCRSFRPRGRAAERRSMGESGLAALGRSIAASCLSFRKRRRWYERQLVVGSDRSALGGQSATSGRLFLRRSMGGYAETAVHLPAVERLLREPHLGGPPPPSTFPFPPASARRRSSPRCASPSMSQLLARKLQRAENSHSAWMKTGSRSAHVSQYNQSDHFSRRAEAAAGAG